jgi:hypothetical protein
MSFLEKFQKSCAIAALSAACMTSAAFGQAQPNPTTLNTPVTQGSADPAKIEFAQQRGGLLFRLDRAAWIAGDAFKAVWRGQPGVALGGWVVEEAGDRRTVTFYGKAVAGPIALARYEERNGRITKRDPQLSGPDAILSEAQLKLVRARDSAFEFVQSPSGRQRNIRPCTAAPFNTVVIPTPNPDGAYEVYLMSPWVETAVYPLGGHFRLSSSRQGEATFDRAFTSSCLNLPTSSGNARAEALVLSHLLDPQPTEIHVFASQTTRLPIYVAISSGIFSVNGTTIKKENN